MWLFKCGLIAILLIASTTAYCEDLSITEDVRGTKSLTVEINPKISKLKIDLTGNDENFIASVDIYLEATGTLLQHIDTSEDVLSVCRGCQLLQFEDLNFDGFLDMLMLREWGSHGAGFNVWIYNPKTGRFEQTQTLPTIENYKINKKKKEIVSTEVMSAFEGVNLHYKARNNKFVLFKKVESKVVGKKIVTTTLVVTKGKWKTIDTRSENL